ncbi:serine/threonine protein kinase-like protein [Xylogone sp. PMI_703]|nr:serine/threonine protein kinase-like protein [Xylogone sp. PMI_703]
MSWKITKTLRNKVGIAGNSTSTDDYSSATREPQSRPQSSILTVILYESTGFFIPAKYEQVSSLFHMQGPLGGIAGSVPPTTISMPPGRIVYKYLPYAILEFDKSQVLVNPVSGTPAKVLWAGDHTPYKFDVSRAAGLTVSLYLRDMDAPPGSGRNHDICIGTISISPRFEENHRYIEWFETQHSTGIGKFRIGLEYIENKSWLPTIGDFNLLTPSEIVLATQIALSQVNNPFIIPLKFIFQSSDGLYFASAFVHCGDISYYLMNEQCFDVARAKLYAAEILCALECLHGLNVICRYLKPKNILLDYSGHIALCDLGLYYRLDIKDKHPAKQIRGTPPYAAPELLLDQGYTKTVDWWTLGILLYKMLTGSSITGEINRVSEPSNLPGLDMLSPSAKDIIIKLLDGNPEQRLGANGASEIKVHPFFHDIDWHKLLQRGYEPTFKPYDMDEIVSDIHYQDPEPEQDLRSIDPNSEEMRQMSEETREQFVGWTYRS